jgi:peptidoglycan hydrolase-like protein with peptidoglycan-binding domain
MVSIGSAGRMDLEEMLSRAESAMNRANQQRAMEAQRAQSAQSAQGSPAQNGGNGAASGQGQEQPACKPPVDATTQAGARQAAVGAEAQRRSSMDATPVDGASSSRPRRGLSGEGNPVEAKPQATPAARPTTTDVGSRTLRRGDTGDDVRALQRSLNERGARLQEDGVFGRETERAVRGFQREQGIGTAGVVGARTREKLRTASTSTTGRPSGTGGTSGTSGTGGTQPSGDTSTVQGAARFLLNSPNVRFWNGLSTGSDRANLERLARGERAFVNATGQRVPVNPRMMQALVEMARRGPIQINALTGGQHSHNSRHYSGNAVDLSIRVGNAREIERIANQYGGRRNHERTHIHLSF